MNLKQLIKILQEKPNEEVEYIICNKDGKIIAMDLECKAKDMENLLKVFGANK